jgi:hypothetical protein
MEKARQVLLLRSKRKRLNSHVKMLSSLKDGDHFKKLDHVILYLNPSKI